MKGRQFDISTEMIKKHHEIYNAIDEKIESKNESKYCTKSTMNLMINDVKKHIRFNVYCIFLIIIMLIMLVYELFIIVPIIETMN